MPIPELIGNINCFCAMSVTFNGTKIEYNGTTLDKVRKLVAAGAVDGDLFTDDENGRTLRVYAAPHDDRAGGFWVTSWNEKY